MSPRGGRRWGGELSSPRPALRGERSDRSCDPGEGRRRIRNTRIRGEAPHPNPLRASSARLAPAKSGAREKGGATGPREQLTPHPPPPSPPPSTPTQTRP